MIIEVDFTARAVRKSPRPPVAAYGVVNVDDLFAGMRPEERAIEVARWHADRERDTARKRWLRGGV